MADDLGMGLPSLDGRRIPSAAGSVVGPHLTVDAGLNPDTCGFYSINSRGQHTALRADQYEYDPETGLLKVFNLGSGVMGIGYTL